MKTALKEVKKGYAGQPTATHAAIHPCTETDRAFLKNRKQMGETQTTFSHVMSRPVHYSLILIPL